MTVANREISYISARKIKQLDNFDAAQYQGLAKMGIHIPTPAVREMMKFQHSMDTAAMAGLVAEPA